MNSAAAIIEAINARSAPASRMREAARASWLGWLDRWSTRPGRVTGAPAQAVVDQLVVRPLAAPAPRAAALTRWQAFATLWRQQWHPASADERSWRWTAGGVSFGWHIVLALLLVWIAAMRLLPAPTAAEDEAVQVEFIGLGTPAEEGGGPAPTAAPTPSDESPAEAARSAASASTAAGAVTAASPPESGAPDSAAAEPSPVRSDASSAPSPTQQPLVVSTPVSPEPPVFELPPTRTLEVTVAPPRVETPTVEAIDIPERTAPSPRPLAQIETEVRPLPSRPVPAPVDAREIPERVVLAPRPVSIPAPTVDAPQPSRPAAEVAQRVIPDRVPAAPASRPAPASATSATTAATRPAPASAASGASPSTAVPAGPRSAPPSAGVGVGPRPAPTPGAFPTARRADDWGESTRDRSGGVQPGLAGNGDAWPGLGNPPGSASAGLPPGMVTQEIRDLDRAGTWLRRTPNGYEPTRFDRFWRPNETLLQEWVRRGVKEVAVPVPGTGKRIVCKVSLLALGGACSISDPNLNEQPASARPPPDVPFKPHLQESSGLTVPAEPAAAPPSAPPPGG